MPYMNGQVLDKYLESTILREDLEYLLKKFDEVVKSGVQLKDRLAVETMIDNYYNFYCFKR